MANGILHDLLSGRNSILADCVCFIMYAYYGMYRKNNETTHMYILKIIIEHGYCRWTQDRRRGRSKEGWEKDMMKGQN